MHSPIEPLERLRHLEMNELIISEFAQPPALRIPRHYHECATVLFTLRGFAADQIAGRVYECNPSSVLIRPAGEVHTHHYGRRGAHCLVIEVKPHRREAIRALSQVLDRVGSFNNCLLSQLATRLYME